MVNIPIRDIPGGIATPNGQALLAMDNGISVLKTTVSQVVLAGRPTATQQEAIDGSDNLKAMTPLTVAQAIEALAIPKGVETEIYDAAETATNAAVAASASAGTANGAAGTAQTSAGQAMAFRNQAQTIADQFGDLSSAMSEIEHSVTVTRTDRQATEAARDAAELASGIYSSIAEGLAATQEGSFFSVPSADSVDFTILYRHESGNIANEIKRYPSSAAVSRLGDGLYRSFLGQYIGDGTGIEPIPIQVTEDNRILEEKVDVEFRLYRLNLGTFIGETTDASKVPSRVTENNRVLSLSGESGGGGDFMNLPEVA